MTTITASVATDGELAVIIGLVQDRKLDAGALEWMLAWLDGGYSYIGARMVTEWLENWEHEHP